MTRGCSLLGCQWALVEFAKSEKKGVSQLACCHHLATLQLCTVCLPKYTNQLTNWFGDTTWINHLKNLTCLPNSIHHLLEAKVWVMPLDVAPFTIAGRWQNAETHDMFFLFDLSFEILWSQVNQTSWLQIESNKHMRTYSNMIASNVAAKTSLSWHKKTKAWKRKTQNTRTQSLLGKDPVTMVWLYI